MALVNECVQLMQCVVVSRPRLSPYYYKMCIHWSRSDCMGNALQCLMMMMTLVVDVHGKPVGQLAYGFGFVYVVYPTNVCCMFNVLCTHKAHTIRTPIPQPCAESHITQSGRVHWKMRCHSCDWVPNGLGTTLRALLHICVMFVLSSVVRHSTCDAHAECTTYTKYACCGWMHREMWDMM